MTNKKILNVDAYPLYWPETWPRSKQRTYSRYKVSFAKARDDISKELQLLGAYEIVISTNIPLRQDGLPYANLAEPKDPGVAVYWAERASWNSEKSDFDYIHRVIACDHWNEVRENMRAANLAIQALRALKRTGATQVIDKAFTGFTALPASTGRRPWREVFNWVSQYNPTPGEIKERFRQLLLQRHPDHGGTDEALRELVAAQAEALS